MYVHTHLQLMNAAAFLVECKKYPRRNHLVISLLCHLCVFITVISRYRCNVCPCSIFSLLLQVHLCLCQWLMRLVVQVHMHGLLLSDEYCSVRQKTQAKIALQSDSVARDERFGFRVLVIINLRSKQHYYNSVVIVYTAEQQEEHLFCKKNSFLVVSTEK